MSATNYALTGDETTALDAALATSPILSAATHVADAQAGLAGLSDDALARVQARLDRLTLRQSAMLRGAYADVLLARSSPAVPLESDWTIDRQTIGGQDTLIVTTP